MRTKTRIQWTTVVFGILLQYTEVLGDDGSKDIPTTPSTVAVVPASTTSVPTVPSSTYSSLAPTVPVNPTSTHIDSAPKDSSTTVPPIMIPAFTVTIPMAPTTTVPISIVPTTKITTMKNSATTDLKAAPTDSPIRPASTAATSATPAPTELTSLSPATTKPVVVDSAHKDPTTASLIPVDATPAGSTHSNPVPVDSSTAVPTSVGTKPAEQTSTLGSSTLSASATVGTKPSAASTQPIPVLTSQDQLSSTQGPALTTVFQPETTKPIIREKFNETIRMKDMQDPRHKENPNVQICLMLLNKLTGNCSLIGEKIDNDYKFTSVSVKVDPSVAQKIYDEINTQPSVPLTLIAILSSCGALVLILVFFALYCMYHHRSYRKNQQHLTEELQTVENGYHDNPTLEVMEVQPEMQEKKVALNGEFNDSWIVPFDNLAKEDIPDEEDTHL